MATCKKMCTQFLESCEIEINKDLAILEKQIELLMSLRKGSSSVSTDNTASPADFSREVLLNSIVQGRTDFDLDAFKRDVDKNFQFACRNITLGMISPLERLLEGKRTKEVFRRLLHMGERCPPERMFEGTKEFVPSGFWASSMPRKILVKKLEVDPAARKKYGEMREDTLDAKAEEAERSRMEKEVFKPLVLTGPSGVGISSTVSLLMAYHGDKFVLPVLTTTKKPDVGENQLDYTFVSASEFESLNQQGLMLAVVVEGKSGESYGVNQFEIDRIMERGLTPLMQVPVDNARHLQESGFKANFVTLLPKSLEDLEIWLARSGRNSREIADCLEEAARIGKLDPVGKRVIAAEGKLSEIWRQVFGIWESGRVELDLVSRKKLKSSDYRNARKTFKASGFWGDSFAKRVLQKKIEVDQESFEKYDKMMRKKTTVKMIRRVRKPIVLCGPPGAGISMVLQYFLMKYSKYSLFEAPVCHTTKKKDPWEVEGKDYYFVDSDEFSAMRENELFVDVVEANGDLYGVSKLEFGRLEKERKRCVFDVSVSSAERMFSMGIDNDNVLFVYLGTSIHDLESRLKGRETMTAIDLEHTTSQATEDLKAMDHFENVVMNEPNEIKKTTKEVFGIIENDVRKIEMRMFKEGREKPVVVVHEQRFESEAENDFDDDFEEDLNLLEKTEQPLTPLVVTGVPGVGKSTTVSMLLRSSQQQGESEFEFAMPLLTTTKEMTAGEEEGKDYYFVSREQFQKMVSEDTLIDVSEQGGELYGINVETIERIVSSGVTPVCEMLFQGARELMERGFKAKFILLLPPSLEDLEMRLGKGQQNELEIARKIMSEPHGFQNVVVSKNGEIKNVVNNVIEIYQGRREPTEIVKETKTKREPVVLCGPVGVGLSTLTSYALSRGEDFAVPPLTTSKRKEEWETNSDFNFVSAAQFKRMEADLELVDCRKGKKGEFYGIAVCDLESIVASGDTPICEMSVEGAKQLMEMGFKAKFVLVLPPSIEELENRLMSSNRDVADVRRLVEDAKKHLSEKAFRNIVVSPEGRVAETFSKILDIVHYGEVSGKDVVVKDTKKRTVILTGPKGVGISSVVAFFVNISNGEYSTPRLTTTKKPSVGETEKDYIFVSQSEFDQLELLDVTTMENFSYGVDVSELERIIESGVTPLCEMSVSGARAVLESGLKADVVLLLPPSLEDLEMRLMKSNRDVKEVAKLLDNARELVKSKGKGFSKVVISGDDEVGRTYHSVRDLLSGGVAAGEKKKKRSEVQHELSSRLSKPIVLTGPSGVGLSSVVSFIVNSRRDKYCIPLMTTNRKKRVGESDLDFNFVSTSEFDSMVSNDDLLDVTTDTVEGVSYGVLCDEVERIMQSGMIPLLEMSAENANSLKERGFKAEYILLVPPSLEELEMRLTRSNRDVKTVRELLESGKKVMEMGGFGTKVVVKEGVVGVAANEVISFFESKSFDASGGVEIGKEHYNNTKGAGSGEFKPSGFWRESIPKQILKKKISQDEDALERYENMMEKRTLMKKIRRIREPIIITGPAGTGKSSALSFFMMSYKNTFAHPTQHTTRAKKEHFGGGGGGVVDPEFHFVDEAKFLQMKESGEFIDTQEVGGHLYGITFEELARVHSLGRRAVFETTVHSAESILARDVDVLVVYIAPPSLAELEKWLRNMGTMEEGQIERTLSQATEDLKKKDHFDFVILNDGIGRCSHGVFEIVKEDAEKRVVRMKRK